jgi:hypothetical protein
MTKKRVIWIKQNEYFRRKQYKQAIMLNLTWILPDEVEMAIRFPMSHAMLVSSSPAEERDCCMKSIDRMKLTE